MSEMSALDQAHALMEAAGEDDAARLRFFERVADAELFVMLKEEATGDSISPEVFEIEGGSFILVFDREERLAQFAEQIVPYAALSGRVLASMLRGQDIGLGLNLGVAPSQILLPPDSLEWLAETLEHSPEAHEARPNSFDAPKGLPEVLLNALSTKLATAAGLAKTAYLVAVTYDDGRRGHLLGIIDAVEGAENALAKAVGEALTFSGIEAGEMDVAFFAAHEPVCAMLAKSGLRFDLPEPVVESTGPSAPGRDPNAPPILK